MTYAAASHQGGESGCGLSHIKPVTDTVNEHSLNCPTTETH